jgi:hypothetical protein
MNQMNIGGFCVNKMSSAGGISALSKWQAQKASTSDDTSCLSHPFHGTCFDPVNM